MIKLKAPFQSGMAGQFPVVDGICEVEDHRIAAELQQAPHNFVLYSEPATTETENADTETESDAENLSLGLPGEDESNSPELPAAEELIIDPGASESAPETAKTANNQGYNKHNSKKQGRR